MLDARFSHLYFYQSLNRLQRGLSAIAEFLVKCRYKVSWWNFGFLKNVEKLKLWRDYECALLFYTGVATGRNMEPRCYGRWSLSVVVVLPLRISCWYCCGSRLLSTDLHLYMFLQIAVLLTPPVFEIHYLFALPQRIINSSRICGRRLHSVSFSCRGV